jgi:hypothetical protein
MAKGVTRAKAKKILKHGAVRGKRLTKAQQAYFGARAAGMPAKKKR